MSSPNSICVTFDSVSHRITVSCGSFRVTDLANNLTKTTAIKKESTGIWSLNSNIVVDQDAKLIINSKDVKWLKINTPYGISVLGNLVIDSVKVTGWDTVSGTFAKTDGVKPRAYLYVSDHAKGQMNITNSEIAYMGYSDYGHQGISYSGGSGSILKHNNIHDMWYGFYSQDVKNMVLEHNIVHDNVIYGIDPHSGTSDMIIRFNQVYNIEKNIGIICSLDCYGILIENNTVYNNTDVGIMLSQFTTNSTIRNNSVHNSDTGISIYNNTQRISVYENIISDTQQGIKLGINSTSNLISNNTISNSTKYGICQDESSQNNIISANKIIDTVSPVCVQKPSHQISLSSTSGTQNSTVRIALVSPSFTFAAYNYGHFYNFYGKYGFPPKGTKITTDLNMLTNAPLTHGPFRFYSQKSPTILTIPGYEFFKLMHANVAKVLPDAQVNDLQDEDVHAGKIFDSNGNNIYDIIFLFHQEYVTTEEYHNLKKFVANGGTIIFADSNFFTVEVKYSKENDSVTFVQGHRWQFNGNVAQPGPAERWVNETSDWTGTNFLTDPVNTPINFMNMPFHYTHTEEQYISNPKDQILLDYKIRYPVSHLFNPMVAAYEFDYGKGKILSSSLFTYNLYADPNFENFIENVILLRATGKIITVNASDQTFLIRWIMHTGQISQVSLDTNNILDVSLDRSVKKEDTLRIVLPNNILGNKPLGDLNVTLDGQPASFLHFSDDVETSYEIHLPTDGSRIQIGPIISAPSLPIPTPNPIPIQKTNSSLNVTQCNECEVEANYTVPEFPFASIVLVISLVILVGFYRIQSFKI